MYFYFLLTPWVYVGISTIFWSWFKKDIDFLHEQSASKKQTSHLGSGPKISRQRVCQEPLIEQYLCHILKNNAQYDIAQYRPQNTALNLLTERV
jgi:hypothetical protein